MPHIVCVKCKSLGKPKKIKRGSNTVDFMCWMIFPLGLPYTIWRRINKQSVCRYCGSDVILPADSAAGQRLAMIGTMEYVPEKPVPVVPKQPVLEAPEQIEEPIAPKPPEPAAAVEKKAPPPEDPNIW